MNYTSVYESPIGPISVEVDAGGGLCYLRFGPPPRENPCPSRTAHVTQQLDEYFRRKRTEFELPLAPGGTEFQNEVWQELVRIPYGQTTTYGDLARKLGRDGAARAVGRANATNPIALIVPCHRVIGANGSLTGFAYGTDIKQWLLAFEAGNESSLFD